MSKRTRIGPYKGTYGIFISQPGEDVDTTTRSLLLDSRYDNLKVHHSGNFSLTRGENSTVGPSGGSGQAGYRFYRRGIAFPALPYRPLHTYAVQLRGSRNLIRYPVHWPLGDIGEDNLLDFFGFNISGSTAGVSDRIDVEAFQTVRSGDQVQSMNVQYTIYKMPVE
jgi:hypothetical protein